MAKKVTHLTIYQFLLEHVFDVSIIGDLARNICRCKDAPKKSLSVEMWRKYLRSMTSCKRFFEAFEIAYEAYLKFKTEYGELMQDEAFKRLHKKDFCHVS